MKKIFFLVGVGVVGVLLIFGVYGWFLNKQGRVLAGTASPDFPYLDYTSQELERLYPQYPENNAPTIQTPEETYQLFLSALKKGNFDEAVNCCFRMGDRERMKDGLLRLQKSGDLKQMINDLDTKINLDLESSWDRTYTYSAKRNGVSVGTTIDFTKTTNGIWYIKSL